MYKQEEEEEEQEVSRDQQDVIDEDEDEEEEYDDLPVKKKPRNDFIIDMAGWCIRMVLFVVGGWEG